MKMKPLILFAALFGLVSQAAAHDEDFGIGSDTPGGGSLVVEAGTANPIPLPGVTGLLNGFALDDPGFASIDEPDEGIFGLLPGASIRLEVLSVDSDFKAYTPGFADVLDAPGDFWNIGSPDFDEHLTWHIDSDDPDYVASRPFWTMQFRVVDVNGIYEPSAPVTAQFVPEPASVSILVALVMLYRSRRRM